MISNAQEDVYSDQSEEDMSQMEVMIRTIQSEVTGLKVTLLSLNLILEENVQR